jgi:hypothetical protein
MQWLETGLRDALLRDGRNLIEALFNDRQLLPDHTPAKPLETRHGNRILQAETLFGCVQLRRSYYHHRKSRHGRFPLDEALDLVRGHTPALARLICRASTQTVTDEQGQPLRDPDSTSYVGTLEDCRVAGILLRQEAFRRGYATAKKVVYLGDGSAWVWENARLNFPDVQQILDFYHVSEHIGHLAAALWGTGTQQAKEWQTHWCRIVKDSDTLAMIRAAEALLNAADHPSMDETRREAARREINYFLNQQPRTRYGYFRSQGWFIGSGVVEAGCKTIVGRRMKQSGMFWSQTGGEDLIGLRCLIKGPHFEQAWKARVPILNQQRAKARRWTA